jgi:hypothetical protein
MANDEIEDDGSFSFFLRKRRQAQEPVPQPHFCLEVGVTLPSPLLLVLTDLRHFKCEFLVRLPQICQKPGFERARGFCESIGD